MTRALWVPERQDIIWINFNPQVGREKRDMHLGQFDGRHRLRVDAIGDP